ncbi:MAG: hypothetical protein LUH15_15270 [Tannerellaceae bacterium]|nr:hypothetical protein [Tannerellaceae bacterium]
MDQYLKSNSLLGKSDNDQLKFIFIIDKEHPFKEEILPVINPKTTSWLFYVTSEEDCIIAENIIESFPLSNYTVKPLFNGRNLAFFEEHIFTDEDEIQSLCLSKREIHAHQNLNTYDFGRLTITPDSKIYTNLNLPPAGNLSQLNLHHLIYKEITEGSAWLRVRNNEPCNKCLYQWLCPSPANYEYVLNRTNLCNLKVD